MSANEAILSANRPQTSANRPQNRLKVVIEIEYETFGLENDRDVWVIKSAVRRKSVEELLKWLKINRPDWAFTVINSRIEKD